MPDLPLTELAMSRIWQAARLPREMRTTDGRRIHVVYPGVWTHSDGPDFRDALIEMAGSLLRGNVELHLRPSDWKRHGHDTNPAYDTVILHVVYDNNHESPVEQPPNRSIPTLELRNYLASDASVAVDETASDLLGTLGQFACLPTLAHGQPQLIRAALRAAGWKRFTEKQLRFSQEFDRHAPAEVLYRGLLDGLGLMQNRSGMARVAERLPLQLVEQACAGIDPSDHLAALAVLLGVGGFLPFSPSHAQLAEIDPANMHRLTAVFETLTTRWALDPLPTSIWNLNRVRPMNHPVRRLASLAALIHAVHPSGILHTCLDVTSASPNPWRSWLDSAIPAIGEARAIQLSTNVLAPFAAAYAQASGDAGLTEAIGAIWERLPGKADDTVARTTLKQIVGNQRFVIRLAVESQGLHQIGRHGCQHLRCFECPIAALAMRHERAGL